MQPSLKFVHIVLFSIIVGMATAFCVTVPSAPNSNRFSSVNQVSWNIESEAGGKNKSSSKWRPAEIGHPSFMSPHASPIAISGEHVFVVNTQSDTLDVIHSKTRKTISRIAVGIDPVSIAVRPDGKEVWVANHVSDSVSVIDNDSESKTYHNVVATVQDFDLKTKATRFDEPVGIAFANNEKAYVALSSENKIAVVDVGIRKVTKRLNITAQDPRAITVRDDRLYVIPFESNNKTQLSGGSKDDIDGELVTFDAWDHSITHNNVLSLGHVLDIIKHPRVPDRDLYVFDTKTDKLVKTVDTLGTLLYGLTVDSKGNVFIAQTDARNDANGRAGTKDHGLKELENRAFLNQITSVNVADESDAVFFDLEPVLPKQPTQDEALATPFAIQVSADDSTLVVSAAGSDKLFTVDVKTGKVLGRVETGAVPRGIPLDSDESGKPIEAWVYNAVANTVSLVDVSDTSNLKVVDSIELEDPTHPEFKKGRIAFNTALASTNGTFSCASCHPDGHTDQLLWVLKTPIVTRGDQIMPRSTMPLRGLRDTAPFHWDGIPGDPYGGNNSEKVAGHVEPNSDPDVPESTTRHVIDGALASTMALVGDPGKNDEGKEGLLSADERDAMAKFLLNIPFPPAQRRAYTNVVSPEARRGFELFHVKGDDDPSKRKPNVCGDCHRMPFLVSTNTPGTGMDAPTWRGAYDRWLILPQGRLNIIDFDFYRRVADRGGDEQSIWRFSWGGRPRFNPVWNMVLENSTGYSGAFARQVTVSEDSADAKLTKDLLGALEQNASEGQVVLQVEGMMLEQDNSVPVVLQYDADFDAGKYIAVDSEERSYTREELISLARKNSFVGTFTARHGVNADFTHPQPAIWTQGEIHSQRGRQLFPIVHRDNQVMEVSGRHIRSGANVLVNGRRVEGSVSVGEGDLLKVELGSLPPTGLHTLQIQNQHGLLSNDFLFHVTDNAKAAKALDRELEIKYNPLGALASAIQRGDLDEVKNLVAAGSKVSERNPDTGSTPLSVAANHNRIEIAKFLIEKGARVSQGNRDGNTPLHSAAFFCNVEFVKLLLDNGAAVEKRNNRRDRPVDVVSDEWSERTAGVYRYICRIVGVEADLEKFEETRPAIVEMLTGE